ncbi:cytochrome C oxidase subunit II [Paenibacillus provencensis]|uniref:Cytochrome C oxidase subunit II n=1 Tax=Paenibacillus provencensis TaxID=441151 RepID=A0ABW3PUA0_9BACL|nr:cytochrome C oxidase subunit II [Paenibacillus sp. MER 78]MCM3127404.1 cytochrome C oxidase subunit II [Paenibacillus sp. MER 78]
MKKASFLLFTLMLLFVLAACGQNPAEDQGGGITEPEVAASDEIVIKATNYEFDQPEYRIKKGVPVRVVYENVEGNHGIIVPGLSLQLDRNTTSKVITPEETGEFEIACSVFCGTGHSTMISKIIVEE